MLKKINDLWFRLTGSPSAFALERRIFHSISIGLIILSIVYVPYNFFEGLYIASISAFIIGAFFFQQYYNSRVNGRAHSNTLFGLTGLLIFSVNYFANSGINGSTDLIWPAYLLLVFAISPYRQHLVWLIIYMVSFLALHVIAYYYPDLVRHPFSAGKGELIDRVTAFPIPIITIYIISHDMRAPLISIQNYLELLNEHELDSLQRPVLEQELLKATNSTMDMLSNLLLWSRSQMEGPAVKLLSIKLLTSLKSTLEMAKTQAEKKGIFLNYYIEPEIQVMADADMLQLVVRNLVSNAIKFTQPGGMVNVDAQLVAQECKITVSDNGRGIDQHKLEKIFSVNTEPAYGTNNERGVGLGLILCKEFIERQGGSIGFESVLGEGSSFFIFIPGVHQSVINHIHALTPNCETVSA